MRYKGLSLITATIALTSLLGTSAAQERFTGEVQAITSCELYAESDAPACPQIMVPIKSILVAVPIGRERERRLSILLRSNIDGHISAMIPSGRYRIVLRRVETPAGRFNPRALKITPNGLMAAPSTAPTLFLVSHRSRKTLNQGIAVGVTSD